MQNTGACFIQTAHAEPSNSMAFRTSWDSSEESPHLASSLLAPPAPRHTHCGQLNLSKTLLPTCLSLTQKPLTGSLFLEKGKMTSESLAVRILIQPSSHFYLTAFLPEHSSDQTELLGLRRRLHVQLSLSRSVLRLTCGPSHSFETLTRLLSCEM